MQRLTWMNMDGIITIMSMSVYIDVSHNKWPQNIFYNSISHVFHMSVLTKHKYLPKILFTNCQKRNIPVILLESILHFKWNLCLWNISVKCFCFIISLGEECDMTCPQNLSSKLFIFIYCLMMEGSLCHTLSQWMFIRVGLFNSLWL